MDSDKPSQPLKQSNEEREIRQKEKEIDKNLHQASKDLDNLQQLKNQEEQNLFLNYQEDQLKEYIIWLQKNRALLCQI